MNDIVNNRLDTFRLRLIFLNKPENLPLWSAKPPLKFTQIVATASAATDELALLASRQSVPTTGHADDKRREELELEDQAFTLARAYVNATYDIGDAASAAKYDLPISGWRRLRDEALLQKARALQADATALAAGTHAAAAAEWGVNSASIARLKKEADDYEAFIAAPASAIQSRAALTASLIPKSLVILKFFDQLDDLVLQFRGTPAGDAFATAWLATAPVIPRGHRYEPEPPTPQ